MISLTFFGYVQICIYYDYEGIEKWANGLWKANKIGTQAYQKKVAMYLPIFTA